MTVLLEEALTDLTALDVRAGTAEIARWQGRHALRLEDALALIPGLRRADACVEVTVGTDGPAYPGVAFRVADTANLELAYAVPHVTGQWDALQYDPVFHGSNTWQLYYGPGHQGPAQVPSGRWFRLRVIYCGTRASIAVDDQPPLIVPRLAHPTTAGALGLWTYRPAYYCDLRVSTCSTADIPASEAPNALGWRAGKGSPTYLSIRSPARRAGKRAPTYPSTRSPTEGIVDAWFAEGYGIVACEPSGVLLLNRYLPASLGEVHLRRAFELTGDGPVTFACGYSDALTLALDGEVIYEGENTFKGFADRATRGYAELGQPSVKRHIAAGAHTLSAVLKVSEPFGWGLVLSARGTGLCWLDPM